MNKNKNENNQFKMKISKLIKTIFFSSEYFSEIKANLSKGFLFFVIVCLIFVIPTEFKKNFGQLLIDLLRNFLIVFVLFFVVLLFIFILLKIFRSPIKFDAFFSNINFILGMSLILISVPAFIFATLIFEITKNTTVNLVLFSLIPYYTYVLFGWLCETSSGLKGWKSNAVAIISMTLIFLFHYGLQYITV